MSDKMSQEIQASICKAKIHRICISILFIINLFTVIPIIIGIINIHNGNNYGSYLIMGFIMLYVITSGSIICLWIYKIRIINNQINSIQVINLIANIV